MQIVALRHSIGEKLGRRDSNLRISESEFAKSFEIALRFRADRAKSSRPETFSRIDCKHRVRHPIASSSMPGCAANQQQCSPEMTGFPAPTERHCCGMIEGLGPSGILPRRLFC